MRLPRLQKTSGGSDLLGSSRTDERFNTGCIFVALSTYLMFSSLLLSFLLLNVSLFVSDTFLSEAEIKVKE